MVGPLLGLSFSAVGLLVLVVKATIVLAGAWALSRSGFCRSAAVRHGVWSVALLAMLALPLASSLLPAIEVGLPAGLHPVAAATLSSPPLTFGDESALRATRDPLPPVAAPAPSSPPIADSDRPTLLDRVGDAGVGSLLLLAWLIGACLRLVWVAGQFLRTERLIAGAVPARDSRHLHLGAELAAALGIRRRVRFLESRMVSMPLASGFIRPVVVLPEDVGDWPPGRLKSVLLHELAHIRRWDYLTSLIAEVAAALYWLLPFVWFARRELRLEQEQACDDRVLGSGTLPVDYAEHLLAVARAFYGRRLNHGAAVTMAREVDLKRRVRAILDRATDRRPLRSRVGAGALATLVVLFLPLATLRGEASASTGHGGPLQAGIELVHALEHYIVEPAVAEARSLLWLEAEGGERGSDFAIREDLEASGIQYVLVQDRAGDGTASEVRFNVTVTSPGDYFLWTRIAGGDSQQPALSATFDETGEVTWRAVRVADAAWSWTPATSGATPEDLAPVSFRLAAGSHTLRLRALDSDLRIDRILLSKDPNLVPSGRGETAGSGTPHYQVFEAETARLQGSLVRSGDVRASGGEYLTFRTDGSSGSGGTATFEFDVATAGRYLIWGRVISPNDEANSFFASLDGAPEVIWDTPAGLPARSRSWGWDPMNARGQGGRTIDPLAYDLRPGRHVLVVRTREAGVSLDAILVTDDLEHRPRGILPDTLPALSRQIWIEAEWATLSGSFQIRSDSAAAGQRYLQTYGDGPSAPGSAGLARFTFGIEDEGLYTLWGRTRIPQGAGDSFWVRVDGGEWTRWSGIPRSSGWMWSVVENAEENGHLVQFHLRPGPHTIEVAGREDGATLDRLLLTNDPRYHP